MKQCCLCGKSGHEASDCGWLGMIITKTKCQACGCYGIHACMGKIVTSDAKLDFTKLDEFICRQSNQS